MAFSIRFNSSRRAATSYPKNALHWDKSSIRLPLSLRQTPICPSGSRRLAIVARFSFGVLLTSIHESCTSSRRAPAAEIIRRINEIQCKVSLGFARRGRRLILSCNRRTMPFELRERISRIFSFSLGCRCRKAKTRRIWLKISHGAPYAQLSYVQFEKA